MYHSITLVDVQLDAQNSRLLTYRNTFIKHVSSINRAHLQEVYVVIVYMLPLVSSLSVKVKLQQITIQ